MPKKSAERKMIDELDAPVCEGFLRVCKFCLDWQDGTTFTNNKCYNCLTNDRNKWNKVLRDYHKDYYNTHKEKMIKQIVITNRIRYQYPKKHPEKTNLGRPPKNKNVEIVQEVELEHK